MVENSDHSENNRSKSSDHIDNVFELPSSRQSKRIATNSQLENHSQKSSKENQKCEEEKEKIKSANFGEKDQRFTVINLDTEDLLTPEDNQKTE